MWSQMMYIAVFPCILRMKLFILGVYYYIHSHTYTNCIYLHRYPALQHIQNTYTHITPHFPPYTHTPPPPYNQSATTTPCYHHRNNTTTITTAAADVTITTATRTTTATSVAATATTIILSHVENKYLLSHLWIMDDNYRTVTSSTMT